MGQAVLDLVELVDGQLLLVGQLEALARLGDPLLEEGLEPLADAVGEPEGDARRRPAEADRAAELAEGLLVELLGRAADFSTVLASMKTCCLSGSMSLVPNGSVCSPLPYPTDLEMLVGRVLPSLLSRDGARNQWDEDPKYVGPSDYTCSEEVRACYAAILRALLRAVLPAPWA